MFCRSRLSYACGAVLEKAFYVDSFCWRFAKSLPRNFLVKREWSSGDSSFAVKATRQSKGRCVWKEASQANSL